MKFSNPSGLNDIISLCVDVKGKLHKYVNFFQRPHAKLHLQISSFSSNLKCLKLWHLQIVILNKTSFLQSFHMMAQPTSFTVLVAALLINTLSYCSAENVYCITPTATSCSSCPRNNHCATLSEYAQEAEMYFTSNTTMVFLPAL